MMINGKITSCLGRKIRPHEFEVIRCKKINKLNANMSVECLLSR